MPITLAADTTNGVQVLTAGQTVSYVTDPVGGWVYKQTITVAVEQTSLADAQETVAAAQATIDSAQAVIDALAPQITTLTAVAQANQDAQAQEVTP